MKRDDEVLSVLKIIIGIGASGTKTLTHTQRILWWENDKKDARRTWHKINSRRGEIIKRLCYTKKAYSNKWETAGLAVEGSRRRLPETEKKWTKAQSRGEERHLGIAQG